MAQVNYSAEMTAKIISDYQNGIDVADIAASVEKSVRSVRSKLVREGVYVAKPKAATKSPEAPKTKPRVYGRAAERLWHGAGIAVTADVD